MLGDFEILRIDHVKCPTCGKHVGMYSVKESPGLICNKCGAEYILNQKEKKMLSISSTSSIVLFGWLSGLAIILYANKIPYYGLTIHFLEKLLLVFCWFAFTNWFLWRIFWKITVKHMLKRYEKETK